MDRASAWRMRMNVVWKKWVKGAVCYLIGHRYKLVATSDRGNGKVKVCVRCEDILTTIPKVR